MAGQNGGKCAGVVAFLAQLHPWVLFFVDKGSKTWKVGLMATTPKKEMANKK